MVFCSAGRTFLAGVRIISRRLKMGNLEKCDVMMYNYDMHRTQVLLEERQYAALRAWARRWDQGISEIIRLAVDRFLGTKMKRKAKSPGLNAICGIGTDPGGPSGREHDQFLYGER